MLVRQNRKAAIRPQTREAVMDFTWLRELPASDWRKFDHGGAAYEVSIEDFLKRSGLVGTQDWRERFTNWGIEQREVFIAWESAYKGRVLITCEEVLS